MSLPKLRGKNVGMNLNRMEKKKIFVVCDNGFAEIEERYKKKYTYSYSFSIFIDWNSLVCHVLLWQKKVEWNCGNDIAEIEGKKIYFSWLLAIPLPKLMGKKKLVAMNLWQWHYRNRMKEKKKFVAIGLWQWHCRNRWEITKSTHILILSVFFLLK